MTLKQEHISDSRVALVNLASSLLLRAVMIQLNGAPSIIRAAPRLSLSRVLLTTLTTTIPDTRSAVKQWKNHIITILIQGLFSVATMSATFVGTVELSPAPPILLSTICIHNYSKKH